MIGKYVYCKKDKIRILYIVKEIENESCLVKGVYYRIEKMVNLIDVIEANEAEIDNEGIIYNKKKDRIVSSNIRNINYKTGKVLHLDMDSEYLDRCLELYNKIGVYAKGEVIGVDLDIVEGLIEKYTPDVVVVTGHDSFDGDDIHNIDNYSNSLFFMKCCKKIKMLCASCIVVAGACQSNFEALIASGADFASSPKRINIHIFDPVVIACRISYTPFNRLVRLNEVYKFVEGGKGAFGGLETYGKMRLIR